MFFGVFLGNIGIRMDVLDSLVSTVSIYGYFFGDNMNDTVLVDLFLVVEFSVFGG